MSEKKSIIEEALLDYKKIEEALKLNTKEILGSTMSREINELVKESLNEEDEEEDESEELVDTDSDIEDEGSVDTDEISAGDEDDDIEYELSGDGGDLEGAELDFEIGDDEESIGEPEEMEYEPEDVIDLTTASDEELISVFKKMTDDDEIEVAGDGTVHINDKDTGSEYRIEFDNEELGENVYEMDDTVREKEEPIYEIELEDEDEDEVLEARTPRTLANKRRIANRGKSLAYESPSHRHKRRVQESINVRENKANQQLLKEYDLLKQKNNEYKKALDIFKTKLQEVAVFNSNLAYVTKLFMEHSTTKKEKLSIIQRFDSATSTGDSKKLYTQLSNELTNKSSISESVGNKINKPLSKGSGSLNESTAYVDPQISKIKDLMNKLESRNK